MIKLNLGCGIRFYNGFINVDKFVTRKFVEDAIKGGSKFALIEEGAEFLQNDIRFLGDIEDNSVDLIESVDAVEHVPFRDILPMLKAWRLKLKYDGVVKVMTTNFNQLALLWITNVIYNDGGKEEYENIQEMIYGNQLAEGQEHRSAWNPKFAFASFTDAGFKDITVTIHPQFSLEAPDIEANFWVDGYGYRSEMMVIKGVK